MKVKFKKTAGFTLIELLIVIAIIGLLSSVVLASLNSARKKARDARTFQDVKQITTALELARDNSSNDKYPEGEVLNSGKIWSCLKPSGNCWRGNYDGGAPVVNALAPYISSISKPPGAKSGSYMYDSYLYTSKEPAWNSAANSWNGTKSAYIIYTLERPFTANECSGLSYNAQNYDVNNGNSDYGLYYCYKFIGYNE